MNPRRLIVCAALLCLSAHVRAEDAPTQVNKDKQELRQDQQEMQSLDAKHAEAEKDISNQEKTAIDAVKADSQLSDGEKRKKIAGIKKEYRDKRKDMQRQFVADKKKLKRDMKADRKELRDDRREQRQERREMGREHGRSGSHGGRK